MRNLLWVLAAVMLLGACSKEKPLSPEEDASAFVLVGDVIPDAILEIRYYSTFNFIGEPFPDTYFTFPIETSSITK